MDNLKIGMLVLGPVETNGYLAMNTKTKQILVVDPADRADDITYAAREMGGEIAAILLTHGHYDHIGAVESLKRSTDCDVMALKEEAELLADPRLNLSGSHFGGDRIHPDRLLEDGEQLDLCGFNIEVIATPGHTAGGACYYLAQEHVLFAGDTLFQGSVGRSDLPTGDGAQLIRSIKEKLLILPEETMVLPGHGPRTSIGREKQYNPFLKDGGWDMF